MNKKKDKSKKRVVVVNKNGQAHIKCSFNNIIISIDADGNKIKNGIETKINKRSAERFAKQIEIKEQSKFVSLTEQVGLEANIQDDYGSDILSRL